MTANSEPGYEHDGCPYMAVGYPNGVILCEKCGYVDEVLGSGSPLYICDVAGCEQGFPTMDEVVAHERTHKNGSLRSGDET